MNKHYAISVYSVNAPAFNRIAIKIMNRERWRISKSFLTKNDLLVIIWEKPIKRNERKRNRNEYK